MPFMQRMTAGGNGIKMSSGLATHMFSWIVIFPLIILEYGEKETEEKARYRHLLLMKKYREFLCAD